MHKNTKAIFYLKKNVNKVFGQFFLLEMKIQSIKIQKKWELPDNFLTKIFFQQ